MISRCSAGISRGRGMAFFASVPLHTIGRLGSDSRASVRIVNNNGFVASLVRTSLLSRVALCVIPIVLKSNVEFVKGAFKSG